MGSIGRRPHLKEHIIAITTTSARMRILTMSVRVLAVALVLLAGGWLGVVGVASAQEEGSGQNLPAQVETPPESSTTTTTTVLTEATSTTSPAPPGDEDDEEPGVPDDPVTDAPPPDEPEPVDDERPATTAPRPEQDSGPPSASDGGGRPDDEIATQPNPLLVAGPSDGRRQITTDPAGSETAPDGEASDGPDQAPVTATDDAEVKVRRVVWGLIALAVALTALAIYYWWITRPALRSEREPVEESESADTVDPWLTDSTSTR